MVELKRLSTEAIPTALEKALRYRLLNEPAEAESICSRCAAHRLVAQVSKHVTAVIDGVFYDSHNPSRGGTRCVYGFWKKQAD